MDWTPSRACLDVRRDAANAEKIGLPLELSREPAEAEEPAGQQHSQGDEVYKGEVSDELGPDIDNLDYPASDIHRQECKEPEGLQVPVPHVAGLMAEDRLDLLVTHGAQERVGN